MSGPFNAQFLEFANIVVGGAVNNDLNSAATGDRIKLNDYEGCAIVIIKPAGTAGDDLVLDLDQHTAASSGSSKALSAIRRVAWYNGGTTFASGSGWAVADVTPTDSIVTDVLVGGTVVQSNNSGFVAGDAVVDMLTDINDSIIVLDVKSADMDGGGGYNWLSCNSDGNAVGNALVANILYIPYGRKSSNLAPPSVIA